MKTNAWHRKRAPELTPEVLLQADLSRGQRRLQRQRLPRPAVSMVTVERDVGARTLLQAPWGSGFQRSAVVVVGVTTAAAAASQVAVVVEDVVAVVITGMFVARSSLLRSSFGIAVKTRLQDGVQTLHLTSLAPSAARLGALEKHGDTGHVSYFPIVNLPDPILIRPVSALIGSAGQKRAR